MRYPALLLLALPALFACGASYNLRETAGRTEASRGYFDSDDRTGDVDQAQPSDSKPTRLVIYTADLRISVLNHESALSAATAVAKGAGGFVESSETQPSAAESRIVLRVPVARFQETISALARLGTVLDRSIKASDVTKEFLDTENRIALSRIARDRLYVLLKRVTDLKERVKILKEIDRLTSEIDALTARSTYLKSRGDFSTITVSFVSGSNQVTLKRPSVFKWVRELSHSGRSLFEARSIEMTRPPGFFDNSSVFYPKLFGLIAGSGDSLYQAPDGTIVRAGSARNYPRGSMQFWESVLRKELERKGYRILESKQDGHGWLIRTQITENLNTQHYTVFLVVNESWIHAAEAVFPAADSLSMEKDVLAALRSMKGGN
jgi:hypothetical protein